MAYHQRHPPISLKLVSSHVNAIKKDVTEKPFLSASFNAHWREKPSIIIKFRNNHKLEFPINIRFSESCPWNSLVIYLLNECRIDFCLWENAGAFTQCTQIVTECLSSPKSCPTYKSCLVSGLLRTVRPFSYCTMRLLIGSR